MRKVKSMQEQNVLNESDIDTLINLLLRSQQSRTREALCFSIGIDPKNLSFLRDSSDSDFFLLLIRYLNGIGNQEAICKLCCKELSPIFNKGAYRLFLNELAGKLNCNNEFRECSSNIPNQPDTSKTQSLPQKKSLLKYLLTGGVLILTVLTGSYFYKPSSPQTLQVHADNVQGTPWTNKENTPVKVYFKAEGTWLAIPNNVTGVSDSVKGYISPSGDINFRPNETMCTAPVGALIIKGGDGKCKGAYGQEGTFEVESQETVHFLMNDVKSLYNDNKGSINVKLSTSKN